MNVDVSMLTASNQSAIDPVIIGRDYNEGDVNNSTLIYQEPPPPPLPKSRPNNNNVLMMMSSTSSSTPNIIMTNNVSGGNKNKSNIGRTSSSNVNMATADIINNESTKSQPSTVNINLNPQRQQQQLQNEELSILTSYYACARYYLFIVHLLILITLIINTFIHFIFYGSNMSIGSMFLDVHHRQELLNGQYYSIDNKNDYASENYLSAASTFNIGRVQNGPYGMINHRPSSSSTKHPGIDEQIYHCDRSSFLSLLDEFYHQYP
ncbi:hypothetical protein BLA29_005971, partial [Euroglyphus maynei]